MMSSSGPSNDELTNTLLRTLSDEVRREIIRSFESGSVENPTTIDTLVQDFGDQYSERDHRSLRLYMDHTHLPKLDDRGWLDYDSRHGEIRYHGRDDAPVLLDQVLDIFNDR